MRLFNRSKNETFHEEEYDFFSNSKTDNRKSPFGRRGKTSEMMFQVDNQNNDGMYSQPVKRRRKWPFVLLLIFIALYFIGTVNTPYELLLQDIEVGYGKTVEVDQLLFSEDNRSDNDEAELVIVGIEPNDHVKIGNDAKVVVFEKTGEYVVTVEGTDSLNRTDKKEATITVVDNTDPILENTTDSEVLTLNAETASLVDIQNKLSASDEIDGNITDQIIIDDSEVHYNQRGKYNCVASVTDHSGNKAELSLIIQIRDSIAPVLTLKSESIELESGSSKPDYATYISASDNLEGDISTKISVNDSEVKYDQAGSYPVHYSVVDEDGNKTEKDLMVVIASPKVINIDQDYSVSSDENVSRSGGGTVYWVPNGKVYHSTSSCPSLSRSKDIRSGTVAQSGKSRACKVCN